MKWIYASTPNRDLDSACHDPARMQHVYDIGRAAGEDFVKKTPTLSIE